MARLVVHLPRWAQLIAVAVFFAIFVTAGVAIYLQSDQLPQVLAQARADGPAQFRALSVPPGAVPDDEMRATETKRRHGWLLAYERKYTASGRFEDAVDYFRKQLLHHGWHEDESSSVRTTFRRDDSAPASLMESANVAARWFVEVEKDSTSDGAYTFTVRLNCYI